MKLRNFSALLTAGILLLSTAVMPAVPVFADDDDDLMTDEVLTYRKVDTGVEIIDCEESTVQMHIPKDFLGYPIVAIADEAFANCTKLATLTLDAPIETIGVNAFANCTALKSLELPDTVTSLGDAAFYNCNLLEEIILPDSITAIGLYCFAYCFGLKEITMPENLETIPGYCFYYDFSLETVELNANLQTIDTLAFVGCYIMQEINIPASVTYIAPLALLACSSLTDVTVAEGNTAYCSTEDGVLMNADCTELILYPAGKTKVSYTVPDTVKTVSYYAFSGNATLNEIQLPASVTAINEGAFSDCLSLTTVNIPDAVTTIENSLFADCPKLKINIPEQITTIGEYAFYCCEALDSLTIPAAVTTIGSYAFTGCSGITDVTIPETVTSIGDYAFGYLLKEDEETQEVTPYVMENFVLRGNSSSAAKTYAKTYDVKFKQTNFPVMPVMIAVSAVLLIALIVVFIIDYRKRRALKKVEIDESVIADPDAMQDANYSSILGDDENGDPFDRSYGFRIDDPEDTVSDPSDSDTDEEQVSDS